MTIEIKTYSPDYLRDQVDLIWEVSGAWKYPYATSIEQIKRSYSDPNFDPGTRFYAFENGKLMGYVTSAVITKDEEKQARLRFPVVRDNNPEITNALLNKVEDKLEEIGVERIRVPAAEGLGNTLDLADKYGYTKKTLMFIRAKEKVEDIQISGNIDGVLEYSEQNQDKVRNLFISEMGYSEEQGKAFFSWALDNKNRKEKMDKNMVSWKIMSDDNGLIGFSYLFRSDHQPENGQFPNVWYRDQEDREKIIDRLVSAHIQSLRPHGMDYIGTYIDRNDDDLVIYEEMGFNFDGFYSYEKKL